MNEPFTIKLRTSPEFLAERSGSWQKIDAYKLVPNEDGTYSLLLTDSLEMALAMEKDQSSGVPAASGATPPQSVLCKQCDVHVGYQAAGIVEPPDDESEAWLSDHCWVCKRSREEVLESQDGVAVPVVEVQE